MTFNVTCKPLILTAVDRLAKLISTYRQDSEWEFPPFLFILAFAGTVNLIPHNVYHYFISSHSHNFFFLL